MLLGSRILVVDDSRCMLEVLGQNLRLHFSTILFASTYAEAVQQLQQEPDIGAVICDVILPDGDGFKLLEQLASAPKPMPKVLLITARWVEDDWQRALSLGAIGYLPKPVSLRDIRTALLMSANPKTRGSRHRTLAKALVVDPERRERLLCLEIHDISATGALLETTGPLPVGTKLDFEIVYDEDQAIRAKGTVVRAQEPSWLDAGGAAVRFDWIESPQRLEELIRRNDQAPGRA
jgi:CheY-like chemotaxis protein